MTKSCESSFLTELKFNDSKSKITSQWRIKKVSNTNYFKENFKKLKEIQRDNKIKKETRAPVKALWKSSKYDNIESKLKEQLQVMFPNTMRDDQIASNSRNNSSRPGTPDSSRSNVDFIKLNGRAVKNYSLRKSTSTPSLQNSSRASTNIEHYPGKVPQYLIHRKEEWREKERKEKEEIEEKLIPPGHRLMAENERLSTLSQTLQKREELINQLSHLPLRNDTLKLRKLKEELEQKIAKLDEAVKIFSRPKVYVKMNA